MSVKLYYFNATGRAQQIRLVLAAGGVEFEDGVPSTYPPSAEDKAKWASLTKGTTTFSVPILTVDEGTDNEQTYVQSSAIIRKAGRMAKLTMTLPNDVDGDKAAYLTDRAIADADDIRSAMYKGAVMFGASQDKADKYAKEIFPKMVRCAEEQMKSFAGDGPYWGGSTTLSVADVTLYEAFTFYGTNLLKGAEGIENPVKGKMADWIQAVESHENIKAYLEGEQFAKLGMKFDKSMLGLK